MRASVQPCGNRNDLAADVLVGMGITLILSISVFPILSCGNVKSKANLDLSDLHKLAQAGQIYYDQNGNWPLSAVPLVQSGLLSAAAVASSQDPSSVGMANDLAEYQQSLCKACASIQTNYKRSFLGMGDYGKSQRAFDDEIKPTVGAGWLVSLVQTHTNTPDIPGSRFMAPIGTYNRILLSGGVETKTVAGALPNSPPFDIEFLFADGDDAWKKKLSTP